MTPFDDVALACTRIPHLDLNMKFDLAPLHQELSTLGSKVFKPYTSKYPILQDMLARSWHGASLVGPGGDMYSDLSEKIYDTDQVYSITPLGTSCPKMMEVVETLGGENCRCRIMIVKAGQRLNWHSHFFDGTPLDNFDQQKYEIVVHVPLIAPHRFKYSVVDIKQHRLNDFQSEPMTLHEANYPPGQAWMFNSFHMHNVFNYSEYDRVSIMMYLNLKNIKTFNIVSSAVYDYKGPMI